MMDLKDKSFLVTGAGGLLGAAIIDSLLKENVAKVVAFEKQRPPDQAELMSRWDHSVQWVDGDITVKNDLTRVMKGMDGVFHTVALLTPVGFENPRLVHEVNTTGTLNLLEVCKDQGVRKLILSSSVAVYGKPECHIMDENHPLNTVTMYGVTKITCEKMCQVFHRLYGLDYIALRYTLMYGPRLHRRANNSAFILDTIEKIRKGENPVIQGDGSQLYDYLYVDDAARANVLSMKSDVSDEIFNIGHGQVFSITEIVQLILRIMNSQLKIEYQQQGQAFDIEHIRVNTERAKKELNFSSEISLEEGFKRLIAWAGKQPRK